MKILYSSVAIGIALLLNACNEHKATSFNDCPQDSVCLYKDIASTQHILPDTYKAQIHIAENDTLRKGGEINPNVKKDIAITINEILTLSKQSGFCKGGQYDLRSNIQYKDGAAHDTIGYTLSFNLECDVPSQQKNDYDTLIKNIDSKINANKYLSFVAPTIQIIATPQALQQAQDEAFYEALKLAKEQSKNYASLLDKKCELTSADSVGNLPQAREFLKASNMSASADSAWELPIPKEQEITSKIRTKYICK